MNAHYALAAVAATGIIAIPASASFMITQGASAPTYGDHLITFDEPGTPTGPVPTNFWASEGISEMQAGDLNPQVDNYDASFGGGGGWLGENTNSFFGNFGIFMTFDHDVTEMSMQIWDPSGPPSPFGGGLNVILFNDGVEVWDLFVQNGDIAEPAWGGVGDEWFDIVAAGGDAFDEVRILGFGFTPTTFMDNLSWNQAPGAGSLAVLALGGFVGGRRRRH